MSEDDSQRFGQTDEWYRHTRHEQQALWYPEIPRDEAPEARAVRRAADVEAGEATSYLPPVSAGSLDPVSLQGLIPPRRSRVQGPAARPDATTGAAVESADPIGSVAAVESAADLADLAASEAAS